MLNINSNRVYQIFIEKEEKFSGITLFGLKLSGAVPAGFSHWGRESSHYKRPEENLAAGYCSVPGSKQGAVGKSELPSLFIDKAQSWFGNKSDYLHRGHWVWAGREAPVSSWTWITGTLTGKSSLRVQQGYVETG